jgi:hypothetical protein
VNFFEAGQKINVRLVAGPPFNIVEIRLGITLGERLLEAGEPWKAALSLHVAWYNFCPVHSSPAVAPAIVPGISNGICSPGKLLIQGRTFRR